MEGEESFGERYAELLRPIRDLAKNWNIDVASELEDYMEELEDIKVSFDDGETELNFAEGERPYCFCHRRRRLFSVLPRPEQLVSLTASS